MVGEVVLKAGVVARDLRRTRLQRTVLARAPSLERELGRRRYLASGEPQRTEQPLRSRKDEHEGRSGRKSPFNRKGWRLDWTGLEDSRWS